MNLDSIREFWDADVRVENLIWLPGIGQTPGGAFKDFIVDEAIERDVRTSMTEIFPWFDQLVEDTVDDHETDMVEAFAERFAHVDGFLAQVATPVKSDFRRYPKGALGYASSWGYYHTRWMYGATMDEVVAKALAWSKEMTEKDELKGTTRKVSA